MQRRRQHFPASTSAPGGSVLVEVALILPVILLCLAALLDLGLAVARYNNLSACARRAARIAIVRGEKSESQLGPTEWTGTLDQSHAVTEELRPNLLCMQPAAVGLRLTWPDGGRDPGQRVQAELIYQQRSLLTSLFDEFHISARSTMQIVH